MHVQMNICRDVEEQLERLLQELRLEHVAEEIELKKLLHRCTALAQQADVDAYARRSESHRKQGARLTVTNMLRVALELGLSHPDLKDTKKLLEILNKVGVARGYGQEKRDAA